MHKYRITSASRLGSVIGIASMVLLLVANISHIHVKYCLDGKEPSFSLHFETSDAHDIALEDGESANDIESELSIDALQSKFSDNSADLLINTFLYLLSTPQGYQQVVTLSIDSFLPQEPASFLPPPRAPPAIA